MSDEVIAEARTFVWLNRLGGATVGIFAAGVLTLAWGDARYAKRAELDKHEAQAAKLQEHIEADRASFATKGEVAAHQSQPAHAGSGAALASIQAQLAAIQADLVWMRSELMQRKSRGER